MVKSSTFEWDPTSVTGWFIVIYHAGVLLGLPLYLTTHSPSLLLIALSCLLLFLTEIGIGAAYHRCYSHRAFALRRPAEAVVLFLSTLAFQGSVLQWSYEHRKHHAFVDTEDDPYSIRKGFWYAHVLWLFERSNPIEERWVADLLRNRWLVFQHRYYVVLAVGVNVLAWIGVALLTGEWLGAFVLAWWTRLLVSHHLTWFVNSLAHCWGERRYSKEQSAVDNYVIALLTVGEGYHNYHHTFAADYRNGVRWYHFDPVKWTVWTLSRVGQARDLRRYSRDRIRQRLLLEDRRVLLEHVQAVARERREELERRIHQLADALQAKLGRLAALRAEARRLRRARHAEALAAARAELRELRRAVRRDWRSWSQLGDAVLAAPAAA